MSYLMLEPVHRHTVLRLQGRVGQVRCLPPVIYIIYRIASSIWATFQIIYGICMERTHMCSGATSYKRKCCKKREISIRPRL